MSETTTHNPNQVKLTKRGRVAAGLALTVTLGAGAFAAGSEVNEFLDEREKQSQLEHNLEQPDALQRYLDGTAFVGENHDKVVRIRATDAMPPNAFARLLKKDNESQRDLTQQIQPQADAQGYQGVEPFEEYIVEKALVSEEAIAVYAVPDLVEEQK